MLQPAFQVSTVKIRPWGSLSSLPTGINKCLSHKRYSTGITRLELMVDLGFRRNIKVWSSKVHGSNSVGETFNQTTLPLLLNRWGQLRWYTSPQPISQESSETATLTVIKIILRHPVFIIKWELTFSIL